MKYTAQQIGTLVRDSRKTMGVTQKSLAMTSGTGMRFIIDLEKGKDTCQLGKVLTVLNTLGIKINLAGPAAETLAVEERKRTGKAVASRQGN